MKNWLVRGDTHGNFNWMCNGCLDNYDPKETAIIILGDAGFNFYLDKSDERKKKEVNERGYTIYCVRGNRAERPHVEMYYNCIESLEIIYDRWRRYDKTGKLDWWIRKSSNFDN